MVYRQSAASLEDALGRISVLIDQLGMRPHLRPPLPEQQVALLERKCGVSLPSDYRAFITRAGDGGPGPFYGLMSFNESLGFVDSGPGSPLSAPCPLRPDDDYWAVWDSEEEEKGLLPLIHLGCGEFFWLVIAGEARGRVIYLGTGRPCFSDDACFTDLYLRWLEETRSRRMPIGEVRDGCLYYGAGFDLLWKRSEEELLHLASTPLAEPALVQLLQRLASVEPSSRSLPFVRSAATDSRPRVRAAAATVLVRLPSLSDVLPLLKDGDPTVRDAAAFGLRHASDATTTHELTAALQRESNARTYWTIAAELQRRGKLTAELLFASSDSPKGVRQYAAHFLQEVPPPSDLLPWIALATDDDPHARAWAWGALEKWWPTLDPAATGAVLARVRESIDSAPNPERKAALQAALDRMTSRHERGASPGLPGGPSPGRFRRFFRQ
jgi:hypothetical protein